MGHRVNHKQGGLGGAACGRAVGSRMASIGRLRELAAQLRQPGSDSTSAASVCARASAEVSASASSADTEEPIMVIVWSMQANGGAGAVPQEDQDVVRLIEEELGRPIKLWEWSPAVGPLLSGEKIDELSAEEIEQAKCDNITSTNRKNVKKIANGGPVLSRLRVMPNRAEVRMVLGKGNYTRQTLQLLACDFQPYIPSRWLWM